MMDPKYYSKALVAPVVFVSTAAVHSQVDLGSLWIVVAVALASVAWILTPEREVPDSTYGRHAVENSRQEPLSGPMSSNVTVANYSLRDIRDYCKRIKQTVDVTGLQRQQLHSDLDHFYATCKDVAGEWDHLAADALQEDKVRRIMDSYFPKTCEILEGMPTATHAHAVEDFRASLAVLQSEMDEVHRAVLQDNLQELKDNRTFLELQFGVVRKPEE